MTKAELGEDLEEREGGMVRGMVRGEGQHAQDGSKTYLPAACQTKLAGQPAVWLDPSEDFSCDYSGRAAGRDF